MKKLILILSISSLLGCKSSKDYTKKDKYEMKVSDSIYYENWNDRVIDYRHEYD